jgi:hypothetical protein
MADSVEPGRRWDGLPLCCRYRLVHFAVQPIRVRASTAAHNWSVRWALGAMSDGQPEVVGVWPHSIEGVLNWREVFDELAARGVQRIRYAVHVDPAAALAAFPDLKVINSTRPEPGVLDAAAEQRDSMTTEMRRAGGGGRCAASEVPQRVRQLARRVEAAAQLLQRGLGQAATRHGPFESGSVAAAFVEAWLTSAEHRQRRSRIAAYRAGGVGAAAMVR